MLQQALKAVQEPRRQTLMRLTMEQELDVSSLHIAMPDITLGAISQHLRVLRDAGLVERRIQGRRRFYRTRASAVRGLILGLEGMWDTALPRLKQLSEQLSGS